MPNCNDSLKFTTLSSLHSLFWSMVARVYPCWANNVPTTSLKPIIYFHVHIEEHVFEDFLAKPREVIKYREVNGWKLSFQTTWLGKCIDIYCESFLVIKNDWITRWPMKTHTHVAIHIVGDGCDLYMHAWIRKFIKCVAMSITIFKMHENLFSDYSAIGGLHCCIKSHKF